MATEVLNVSAATQLANRTDFVFIINLAFYLIIPRSRAKASIFYLRKMGKGVEQTVFGVYGSAIELNKLKEPLAHLSPAWFVEST